MRQASTGIARGRLRLWHGSGGYGPGARRRGRVSACNYKDCLSPGGRSPSPPAASSRQGRVGRFRGGETRLRPSATPWQAIPEEQRRIAQLLVEDITVSTSGIDIRFRTNGIEQIVEELQPIEERAHA
jgi:hypothetical protein